MIYCRKKVFTAYFSRRSLGPSQSATSSNESLCCCKEVHREQGERTNVKHSHIFGFHEPSSLKCRAASAWAGIGSVIKTYHQYFGQTKPEGYLCIHWLHQLIPICVCKSLFKAGSSSLSYLGSYHAFAEGDISNMLLCWLGSWEPIEFELVQKVGGTEASVISQDVCCSVMKFTPIINLRCSELESYTKQVLLGLQDRVGNEPARSAGKDGNEVEMISEDYCGSYSKQVDHTRERP